MKHLPLGLVVIVFAGCGGGTDAAVSPSAELALPVTTPMQVRERLLNDLEREKVKARERRKAMDEVVGGDR
ncbi:MAG: hypothetical protein KDC98_10250 [Planctomycetes bacterium]|nr:hypothetical protein [Planctomycetota bacterium]